MSWDPVAEYPRALPPLRDEGAEDISPHIAYLANAASVIEGRLLHLIKECAQGAVPVGDFTCELSLLFKDVEQCYRRVADLEERRDIRYDARMRLQEVNQHCIWLYRKILQEQAFFRKLYLETKLRSLISAEAAEVYQELISIEDQDREFLARNDAEIRKLLLDEKFGPYPVEAPSDDLEDEIRRRCKGTRPP